MAHYEDISIDQGADVTIQLELVETDGSIKDLTGYNVRAKMKKNYNSDSDNTINFTALVTTPQEDGIITLTLTNEQTDLLDYKYRYVYDVELFNLDSDDNVIVERILEGKISISPSVTR